MVQSSQYIPVSYINLLGKKKKKSVLAYLFNNDEAKLTVVSLASSISSEAKCYLLPSCRSFKLTMKHMATTLIRRVFFTTVDISLFPLTYHTGVLPASGAQSSNTVCKLHVLFILFSKVKTHPFFFASLQSLTSYYCKCFSEFK